MRAFARLSDAFFRYLLAPAAVALPVLLVGLFALEEGFLSDAHAGFLTKAYLAIDRGRLEMVGFYYPPLPLLLLLPYASVAAPVVWGSLALGAAFAWALIEALSRRLYLVAAAVVLLLATPPVYRLASEDFSQAIGLLLLWLAWWFFERWTTEKITAYGFLSGLFYGAAIYTIPVALPMSLLAAAVAKPIRKLPLGPWGAALLVLVFPVVVGIAIWAYLAWTFTDSTAFLYQIFHYPAPWYPTLLMLFYLVVFLLFNRGALWHLAVVALTLPIAARLGFGYSVGFALAFAGLLPLVNLRRGTPLLAQVLIFLGLLVQLVYYLETTPRFPTPSQENLIERAIGKTLSSAPKERILTDDRTTYRFIAWSETAKPYLLPADGGYEMALSNPGAFVDYVFACPGDSRLYRAIRRRPPQGFDPAWQYRECLFFRKRGAPPLP